MHTAITEKGLSFGQMKCCQHFLNLRESPTIWRFQRSLVMTVIEVKPRKWGWCVFESPGVEPVFLEKDQAIGYAETRARLRTGEIRIFDSTGNVERVIAFDDANRRL
jgi:hypothetical protein